MICPFKMIQCYLQMYLKNFEMNVLKNMNFIQFFLTAPGLAQQPRLKKTEVELELLTDTDMLLIVEKGIIGGIFHAIHRHAAQIINT